MEDQMDWSNNNKACVSTWFYLRTTKQLKTNFEKSGSTLMQALRFWNNLSADGTAASARAWSEWFVSYMITKDGAQFEQGYNWAKTVENMVAIMTNGSKTVTDLAS